jgi:DNA-binding transcriptional MerR regulator
MKTGKAAKMLDVDPKTITNWTDVEEFGDYFSMSALGKDGKTQRDYLDSDILVLNTIRAERNRGANWSDIAALLETGYRNAELPPSALMIDTGTAPVAQYAKLAVALAERDAAVQRAEDLERRLEESETRNRELQDRLLEEVGELRQKIGRLEAVIDFMEKQKDETSGKTGSPVDEE